VDDLGVELNAVEAPGGVFNGGSLAGGRGCENTEAGGRDGDDIAMRHPDLLPLTHALQ